MLSAQKSLKRPLRGLETRLMFLEGDVVVGRRGGGEVVGGLRGALRDELLVAAAAVAAAEELDVVGDDLDRLALRAVLGVPLTPGELALDADRAALGEVLGAVLRGASPHGDVEVVGRVGPFLAALDAVVHGDTQGRDSGAGRGVAQLRVLRQVADEDDAVDVLGHYSSSCEVSMGSVSLELGTSSRPGPPTATG